MVEHQYKLNELYFTLEGTFGLFHPKLKPVKGQQETDEQPAVLIPRHAVFGDYQILLDTYPCVDFCPFSPNSNTPEQIKRELGRDGDVDEWRVMCLDKDDYTDLCELYPETKQNLLL